MSVVISFPRAHRLAADLSRAALLRRIRLASQAAGCRRAEREIVDVWAGRMLDSGHDHAALLTVALDYAHKLIAKRAGDSSPRPAA